MPPAGVSISPDRLPVAPRWLYAAEPPGTHAAFKLLVTPADEDLLRNVPASLAPMAAGRVAVPYFDPGPDFSHVAAIFRSAGLRAVPGRTAARPPTPMRSSPAAGTVVPSGSEVTVLMF